MIWRDDLTQYAGHLHAGMIAALLDTACGFAAATVVGNVTASHFSMNCLRPAVGRSFTAKGSTVRAGRRQVFTRAELFAENEQGETSLVATRRNRAHSAQPLTERLRRTLQNLWSYQFKCGFGLRADNHATES